LIAIIKTNQFFLYFVVTEIGKTLRTEFAFYFYTVPLN